MSRYQRSGNSSGTPHENNGWGFRDGREFSRDSESRYYPHEPTTLSPKRRNSRDETPRSQYSYRDHRFRSTSYTSDKVKNFRPRGEADFHGSSYHHSHNLERGYSNNSYYNNSPGRYNRREPPKTWSPSSSRARDRNYMSPRSPPDRDWDRTAGYSSRGNSVRDRDKRRHYPKSRHDWSSNNHRHRDRDSRDYRSEDNDKYDRRDPDRDTRHRESLTRGRKRDRSSSPAYSPSRSSFLDKASPLEPDRRDSKKPRLGSPRLGSPRMDRLESPKDLEKSLSETTRETKQSPTLNRSHSFSNGTSANVEMAQESSSSDTQLGNSPPASRSPTRKFEKTEMPVPAIANAEPPLQKAATVKVEKKTTIEQELETLLESKKSFFADITAKEEQIEELEAGLEKLRNEAEALEKSLQDLENESEDDSSEGTTTDEAVADEKPTCPTTAKVFEQNATLTHKTHSVFNGFLKGINGVDVSKEKGNKQMQRYIKEEVARELNRRYLQEQAREQKLKTQHKDLISNFQKKLRTKKIRKKRLKERRASSSRVLRSSTQPERKESEPSKEDVLQSRFMRTRADIPDMILDPKIRERQRFYNTNRLVADPVADYENWKKSRQWTKPEERVFVSAYLAQPKNFKYIASLLPKRSISECVWFYYTSKHRLKLKERTRREIPPQIAGSVPVPSHVVQEQYLGSTETWRFSSGSTRSSNRLRRKPSINYNETSHASSIAVPVSDPSLGTIPAVPALALREEDMPMAIPPVIAISPTISVSPRSGRSSSSDSSRWVESEREEFKRSFMIHRKNFKAISDNIGTKNPAQCKNFYHNNKRRLGLVDEPGPKPPSRGRGRPSCHWNEPEKAIFLDKLAQFGKDWRRIEEYIETKTMAQIKNFYQNHRIKLALDELLPMAKGHKKRRRKKRKSLSLSLQASEDSSLDGSDGKQREERVVVTDTSESPRDRSFWHAVSQINSTRGAHATTDALQKLTMNKQEIPIVPVMTTSASRTGNIVASHRVRVAAKTVVAFLKEQTNWIPKEHPVVQDILDNPLNDFSRLGFSPSTGRRKPDSSRTRQAAVQSRPKPRQQHVETERVSTRSTRQTKKATDFPPIIVSPIVKSNPSVGLLVTDKAPKEPSKKNGYLPTTCQVVDLHETPGAIEMAESVVVVTPVASPTVPTEPHRTLLPPRPLPTPELSQPCGELSVNIPVKPSAPTFASAPASKPAPKTVVPTTVVPTHQKAVVPQPQKTVPPTVKATSRPKQIQAEKPPVATKKPETSASKAHFSFRFSSTTTPAPFKPSKVSKLSPDMEALAMNNPYAKIKKEAAVTDVRQDKSRRLSVAMLLNDDQPAAKPFSGFVTQDTHAGPHFGALNGGPLRQEKTTPNGTHFKPITTPPFVDITGPSIGSTKPTNGGSKNTSQTSSFAPPKT